MKLNIDYNGLNSLVEEYLNVKKFEKVGLNELRLDLDFRHDFYCPNSAIAWLVREVFEAFDFPNLISNDNNAPYDNNYYIPSVRSSINDFYYYYKNLANNAKSYDDKKLNKSVEKSLTANLKDGNYKKANNDYDSLIAIYGVKKAKSIVKRASEKTKKKVKFFMNESGYHAIKSSNTKKTSAKKISKKKVKSASKKTSAKKISKKKVKSAK